jgi:hypothetical protein
LRRSFIRVVRCSYVGIADIPCKAVHRSKGERSACIFVTLDRTGCGALSRRRRGRWDDQVAGCATPLMTSRSAVSVLPLVSGPSSTEITTRTRKSIVLIIIGMAKPKFICTAR